MNKSIPYARQSIDDDDIQAVVDVLKSDWLTTGPKVAEFEKALADYVGARYAVAVSNGTAALHVACMAAGIGESDEVITSPMTFLASANCVLYCGGKPVFADIDPRTLCVSAAEIEKQVSPRTKALIPVHFAGHPCDMDAVAAIATQNDLVLIEDAAHALGAVYGDRKVGCCDRSDMAILSFHPVKHIAAGEGGAVLTNREDLYSKLLLLRNHGMTRDPEAMSRHEGPWYYEQQCLGYNYRITDIQCALGLSQMKRLDGFLTRRREIAAMYNELLSPVEQLILPHEDENCRSAWHLYTVQLESADRRKHVFTKLREAGIGVQVHYIPVYLQPYYRRLGYPAGLCPSAEDYYSRTITLPLFPAMTDADVEQVVDTLTGVLKGT